MPRRKKPPQDTNTLSQSEQVDAHPYNEQLPPQGSPPHQSDRSLPKISFNNITERLQAARKCNTANENESVSLPDDSIKEAHHDIWQRMGFYSNHPNHNPTAINEVHIKAMIGKSHKLGKIITKYRLLINKPTGKRAMLMQYPNRKVGQEYRAATGSQPLEIRIKPKSGLVEVDIPVEVHANYNRERGVDYGEAMRKSRLLQDGGSYSLGGGLSIGPGPTPKNDRQAHPPEGPSREKLLENFEDANNKGHVMNKITLGGHIHPFKNGDPIYMAATFKEGEFIKASYRNLSYSKTHRRLHVDEIGCNCPIKAPVQAPRCHGRSKSGGKKDPEPSRLSRQSRQRRSRTRSEGC